MTNSPDTTAPTSVAALGDWLIERIRFYDQVDAAVVTLDAPLSDLGLDSIYVLTLCGDIEDTYGTEIDPTFFEGRDTLGQVAVALHERLAPS